MTLHAFQPLLQYACKYTSLMTTLNLRAQKCVSHLTGGTVRALFLGISAGDLVRPLLTPLSCHSPKGDGGHYAIGSPCGSLTRSDLCFAFLYLCSFKGSPMFRTPTIDARSFGSPVSPLFRYVISTESPETQRVSRGKLRLLSAHDCQIYVVQPYGGYRTLSCLWGRSRRRSPMLRTRPGLPPPQICLPSTLSGTGHTCTSTRAFFCLRLPSGTHYCRTLAFGYPSPPSGCDWTLTDLCARIPIITSK